jgi:hypothetical protein
MAGIKEHIGRRILKKKFKGFERFRHVHNFETAESAVVLFDTADPDSFPAIKDFRKFLESKGLECSTFGYVQQKEVPEKLLFQKNFSFISKRDLNWYQKPSGEVVEAFFSLNPDILFDFTKELSLEIQFLVQLSRAQFKIGCYTEEDNDYDLMINLTQQDDAGYLSEQFKHYVSMLNPSK